MVERGRGVFAQKRLVVAVVAVLAVAAPRAALATQPAPQTSAGCSATKIEIGRHLPRRIEVGGTERAFVLDVPENTEPGAPVALLFDFHGFGHSGEGVWKVSRFKDLAPAEHFITVYPEGLPVHLLNRDDNGWEIFTGAENRDLAFVKRMLDEIESRYCIDQQRVYATGFSNGAFLSNLLACTMADTFAAVAPVSGGRFTLPCVPSRRVPVIIHHGRNDALIAVAQAREMRDAWAEKNACTGKSEAGGCEAYRSCGDGAEVVYCEDDGGHSWPLAATNRIWEFFKKHRLP